MKIQSKSFKEKFISGTIALSLSALIVKIIGVIYKVPLSYILGDEGMGYFNSAYTVYGFFYIICTAGVPKAVAMLITELTENGEKEKIRSVYKYTLSIFLFLGLAVFLAFIILSPFLSNIIGSKKSFSTMLAIAPSIVFVALGGVLRGYLNGMLRLVPIAISQLIEALSKLVLGLLFAIIGVRLNFSLPLISAFSVLGITLGSFFACAYLYLCAFSLKSQNKTRQKIHINKKDIMRRVFEIALPITLSSSVISLSSILDLGLLMHRLVGIGYSEESAAAIYGNYTTLAVPMVNLVVSVLTPLSVAFLPRLASYCISGNKQGFSDALNSSLVFISFISCPCAMIYYLYSFDVLDILFPSYASATGAQMLSALAIGAFLLPYLTMLNTALEARRKISASVISLVVGALVKIISGYVLIGIEGIGILGAPIGTVLSYVTSLLISYSALVADGVKISKIKTLVFPFVLSFVCFSLPFVFVYRYTNANFSIQNLLLCSAISTIMYLFVYISTIKIFEKAKKGSIIHKKDTLNL